MGWNPINGVIEIGNRIDRERRRQQERIKQESEKISKSVELAAKKIAKKTNEQINDAVKEITNVTGVDVKPIVKAIAGQAQILGKIAETHNLSNATTDWVVNHVRGVGEIGGIFGNDVEGLAKTIVSYTTVPILLLTNFSGDTMKIVESKKEFKDLIGSPLKTMLEQAYSIYDKYAEPLPFDLKMVLSRVVDKAILNRARVVIDRTPNNVAGIANALNHNFTSQIYAVTIDDIIIFSSKPNSDLSGYLQWVHELTHVEQYQRWGMLEFAARYTKDFDEVEAEAFTVALSAQPVLEELISDFTQNT